MSNENPRPPRPRVQMRTGEAAPASGATPSQEVLERKNKTAEIVDARGRRITLRNPSPVAQFDFVEMLGSAADIDRYLNMVMPILWVIKIDDDEILAPVRKSELKALIKLLGEDGLAAVGECLKANFSTNPSEQKFRDEVKD